MARFAWSIAAGLCVGIIAFLVMHPKGVRLKAADGSTWSYTTTVLEPEKDQTPTIFFVRADHDPITMVFFLVPEVFKEANWEVVTSIGLDPLHVSDDDYLVHYAEMAASRNDFSAWLKSHRHELRISRGVSMTNWALREQEIEHVNSMRTRTP